MGQASPPGHLVIVDRLGSYLYFDFVRAWLEHSQDLDQAALLGHLVTVGLNEVELDQPVEVPVLPQQGTG